MRAASFFFFLSSTARHVRGASGTTVANLGMNDVAFPAPMFHGDTLSARTTVVSQRPSKKRPTQGVVVFKHEGFNQDGTLVATCTRAALMMTRGAAE